MICQLLELTDDEMRSLGHYRLLSRREHEILGFAQQVTRADLLVSFPDENPISIAGIELTDLVVREHREPVIDASAFHGAYIKFRTHDVLAIQEVLDRAGVSSKITVAPREPTRAV